MRDKFTVKLNRLHRQHAELAKMLKEYNMVKPINKLHEKHLAYAISRMQDQMDAINNTISYMEIEK